MQTNHFTHFSAQEFLVDWHEKYCPLSSVDWQWEKRLSQVKLAMHYAYDLHSTNMRDLDIVTHPVKAKAVIAKVAILPGKLTLVPITTVITMKKDSETISSGAIVQDKFTLPSGEVRRVVLHPKFELPKAPGSTGHVVRKASPPFVAAFWFVKTSLEANMTWQTERVEIRDEVVQLPIIRNHVRIAKGEEIRMPQQAAASKPKGGAVQKTSEAKASAPKKRKV